MLDGQGDTLTVVRYNRLNLPEEYVSASGDTLKYVYSADGEKLYVEERSSATSGAQGTEYAANYRIENGTVTMIHTDAGYYTPTGLPPGASGTSYVHLWYLKDHLGNNRVLANERGIVQSTHNYDPYGAEISISPSNPFNPLPSGMADSPYKYGGKEWNATTSTYDFEARHLSPSFHRFTTMDPLCEKYYSISPYAYCAGDPVNLVDPDGRFPTWLLGLGLDYGTQVYENYQNGKSGLDAWFKDINIVRLGLSAVTPGKKAKVAITLLTEAAKASVSYSINDNVTINTDMKDVAEKTIVGTATDLAVGTVIQKGSSESVSEVGKKANMAASQAEKAARKARAQPNSPKAAQKADKAVGAAQRSREQQVLSEMTHSVVGDSGEEIEKVINQVIQFFHEEDKERKR